MTTWADLLRATLETPDGRRAFLQLISYLTRVAPHLGLKELIEQVHQVIPESENEVMTLAEQLMQQGEQRGLEKGLEKGLKRTVRRLLELKFGPLSTETINRIEAADEAALDRYTERVLTATSLEEVLGD